MNLGANAAKFQLQMEQLHQELALLFLKKNNKIAKLQQQPKARRRKISIVENFRDNVASPRLCREIIAKIAPTRDIVARNAFRDKYTADDLSDILVELFRAHKGDVVIQEFALWATHVLSFRPEDRRKLTVVGVCGAIVSCLRRHQGNATLVLQASWAIQNLSDLSLIHI